MAFSFDFSGDDIEENHAASNARPQPPSLNDPGAAVPDSQSGESVAAQKHDLKDFLASLPDQISYTANLIISPQRERRVIIPRRALFDVRMQIMAEEDTSAKPHVDSSKTSAADPHGLGDSDIEKDVYEGGFKSWEGALDLAQLVLDRGPRKDIDELAGLDGLVELGCGTALPSLVLFSHALTNNFAPFFTFTDYNDSVLRLVTLPNILLCWALQCSPESFSPAPPLLSPGTASLKYADGELVITPELLSAFQADLQARGIAIHLISGPWSSPQLQGLITAPLQPMQSLLILAAETIYSPASLSGFADIVSALLKHVRAGKAIVAAKRIYFGVGGGVDAFKDAMQTRGGVVAEIMGSGIDACDRDARGVGRCLLEVQAF